MSVVWPSASKSIQSRATAISGRLPTMKGTQYASRVSTSIPWLDSRRSTCLLAYLVFSPRASARPWPISATASEPDWIAPSVAPARERMRWACRQSSNRLFSTRWMPSNEICWLADKARPPLSEQEGSNPTFRILAIQSRRHQPACARPFALMLFVSPKLLASASLLIRPRIQMRGAMRFVAPLRPLLAEAQWDRHPLVYLDEAHIHQDVELGYGWAERGKRFHVASSSPGLSAKVSFYGLYVG